MISPTYKKTKKFVLMIRVYLIKYEDKLCLTNSPMLDSHM